MLAYGGQSRYIWTDSEGVPHDVVQGEGGEQGDPLMLALYALGQHAALQRTNARLQQGELLLAYLDDLYLVTTRDRARAAFDEVTSAVAELAGVRPHLGKLRAWSRAGGTAPPGLEGFGDEGDPAWRGDLPPELNGLVVLGTPLGTDAYAAEHGRKRLREEQRLLDCLPKLDLQSAWLLLLYCATPRANRQFRCVPPS